MRSTEGGRAAVAARLVRAAAAAAFVSGPAAAQVQAPSPNPLRPSPEEAYLGPRGVEGHYGPAVPVELTDVAYNGASYQKRHVLTRGVLEVLEQGRYLSLTEGTARVMVIPFGPADYQDLVSLVGLDVDASGVVRVLPARQAVRPVCGLESKCEDPLLPELPNARIQWPPVSITVWKMADRGTGGRLRREGGAAADTGLLAVAGSGQKARALGQFRGANLCGDLPPASRRGHADWVILTAEGPVWVTGRRPEGRGFRLDPADRGDTARWLEVTGRVQAEGEVLHLKADRVALAARPAGAEPVPCAP